MIKHAMKLVKSTTEYANPRQMPIMVCDQPLFALAKQIQWTWQEDFVEHNFMFMMGGLHIEMTGLPALLFFVGSGWTEALVFADVTYSYLAFCQRKQRRGNRYACPLHTQGS